jgi:ribonuclease-3 family protein
MKFQQYQNLKKNLFPFNEQNVLNDRYKKEDINPRQLNPLVLAYVGDAYYHLYIRTRLLNFEQAHVHLLNDFSMQIVSATFQVQAYEAIKDELTETESYIFKRGKNAKSHAPRVASVHDYHISTGFEAILGYLYLNNEQNRLDFLCERSFLQVAKNMYQAH